VSTVVPRGLDGIGLTDGVAHIGSQTRAADVRQLRDVPELRSVVIDYDPPSDTVAAIETDVLGARPDVTIVLPARGDAAWRLDYLQLLPSHRRLNLIYGGQKLPAQLEELAALTTLQYLSLDTWGLKDLSVLAVLPPSLQRLEIGECTGKRKGLSALTRLRSLRTLTMHGPVDDHAPIGELQTLETLNLQSFALPDLRFLKGLTKLTQMRLALGNVKSLAGMETLANLEYLQLWMVRGVSDLSEIGSLTRLRHLFLQAMSQVKALPDASDLGHLHTVQLWTMKSLRKLEGLARAPKLLRFMFIDAEKEIMPKHLEAFLRHPVLKGLCIIWKSNRRRNREFDAMVAAAGKTPSAQEWHRIAVPAS
jgi:hypothetical protein